MSHSLSAHYHRQALLEILPVTFMIFAFGVAFSLAAKGVGMEFWQVMMMSGLQFAGASQFAALDFWGQSQVLLPMALAVYAINARYTLMSAAIYPHLQHLSWSGRLASVFLLTDANWALAMQAHNPALLMARLLVGGAIIWSIWLLGTGLGFYFGQWIHNPQAWALDAVMPLYFLVLLVPIWKGRTTFWPWLVAALVGWLVYDFVSHHWYVVAGALAGGLMGAVLADEPREEKQL